MPVFTQPLQEFNPYHEPAGSAKGGQFAARPVTRVGLTSARPRGAEDYRSPRAVFQDMWTFHAALAALPGVSHVSVKPGVGAWEGGWEPTWIIGYRGNGAARRLLVQTAKAYNQDGLLLMHGCRGADCEPVTEFHFDRPLSVTQRDLLGTALGKQQFGGWTWGRRAGKMVLRIAHVPQWTDMTRDQHRSRLAQVSQELQQQGFAHRLRVKAHRPEVFGRDDYDQVT